MAGRFIFDLEADGLLDTVTKIHCLGLRNIDTGEVLGFADQPGHTPLRQGLQILSEADVAVGHNVLKYDLPTIEQLVPGWKRPKAVVDTLVLARITYPNTQALDASLADKGLLPGYLKGAHSLEAWGRRTGVLKGDYGKSAQQGEDIWAVWTPTMHAYMLQDLEVNYALLVHMQTTKIPGMASRLEHEATTVVALIERDGIPFDKEAGEKLELRLRIDLLAAETALQEAIGPVWNKKASPNFTPKRDNPKKGYVADAPMTKVFVGKINPGSRQMMTRILINRYGWKPRDYTDAGQPKLDDEIIDTIPLADNLKKALKDYFVLDKRLGALVSGKNAWLALLKDWLIHPSYNVQGAATGRATHSTPNIAQVPRVGSPWGKECRSLFVARKGWLMVGSDLSGLELRMLGHEMYRYDRGAYLKIVLEGDPHTANQQAAGLPTRAAAKTFIYGFIYGAGDFLVGSMVPPDRAEAQGLLQVYPGKAKRYKKQLAKSFGRDPTGIEVATAIKGSMIKERFMRGLPALASLKDELVGFAKDKGYILGLDGRRVPTRSEHSVLNFCLQGGGALVCKKWITLIHDKAKSMGLRQGWDGDWTMNAWVHDEVVMNARNQEIAETLEEISKGVAVDAGKFFKLHTPIAAEAKIGLSWADVH